MDKARSRRSATGHSDTSRKKIATSATIFSAGASSADKSRPTGSLTASLKAASDQSSAALTRVWRPIIGGQHRPPGDDGRAALPSPRPSPARSSAKSFQHVADARKPFQIKARSGPAIDAQVAATPADPAIIHEDGL